MRELADLPVADSEDAPLVSVIIPAHNAEGTIAVTLASVLGQTYPHLQIIVVDDGSTDATADIVEHFVRHDARVVLLRQRNQGVGAARNIGLVHAAGEYVAPLDADDVWFPEKIEKQVERLMAAPPTVGVVYAWSAFIDDLGRLTGGYVAARARGDVYAHLVYRNICGSASTPLIRRRCLQAVGGYVECGLEGCEDLDLYLRLAREYRFEVVPEFLVGYRQTRGSMSCNTRIMQRSYASILRRARRERPDLSPVLFRWARGLLHWYMAFLAERGAQPHRAFAHFWWAGAQDPTLLLDPRFRERFICAGRRLFGCVFRVVTRSQLLDRDGLIPRPQKVRRSLRQWRWPRRSQARAKQADVPPLTLAQLGVRVWEWEQSRAGQLERVRLDRIDRWTEDEEAEPLVATPHERQAP